MKNYFFIAFIFVGCIAPSYGAAAGKSYNEKYDVFWLPKPLKTAPVTPLTIEVLDDDTSTAAAHNAKPQTPPAAAGKVKPQPTKNGLNKNQMLVHMRISGPWNLCLRDHMTEPPILFSSNKTLRAACREILDGFSYPYNEYQPKHLSAYDSRSFEEVINTQNNEKLWDQLVSKLLTGFEGVIFLSVAK